MLREDIAAGLPQGHSRPLFVRWTEGGRSTAWVRAGDLRRQGADLVMVPRWDGQAFAVLWQAAASGAPADPPGAIADFAVHDGHALTAIGAVQVTPRLRGRVRDALPRRRER